MRILLVDDNPDDRALVRRALQPDHPAAEFVEAATAAALERVLKRPPDVAVLDFSLGWSNGLDVFRRLKEANPDLAAIMFTGSLGEERAVDMMRAGLGDYILKDVSRLPRLRASVLALVREQRQRQALRRAEERYSDLFRRVSVGLFACAPDGRIGDANPALLRMLGCDSLAAAHELDLDSLVESEPVRQSLRQLTPGTALRCRTRLLRSDGARLEADLHARRVRHGDVSWIEGEVTDVTELQEALEQQRRLLQEVVHRVYNNLQQVTALLQLQARHSPTPESSRGYHDVSDRIRALSLVQRRLHRSRDMQSVDLPGFLHDLAELRRQTGIAVDVGGLTALELSVAKAIPVALLTQELVASALRHAFVGRDTGRIRIGLHRDGDRLQLCVADNGVGAEPARVLESGGVSAQIIASLVREIDGEVEIRREGGLRVCVTFAP
jgi:PAS domain S-box-containing protein